MAAVKKEAPVVSLKLLIDDSKNRVVAAEAKKDFVDILFGFLTLPMATVIRLTTTSGATIGCMNKLYQGVQNLGSEYWQEPICKTMVLNPRNSLADYCKNLVINVDDSGSDITYGCSGRDCKSYYTQYPNLSCYMCGRGTTTIERKSGGSNGSSEGAFLRGGIVFLISDDLRIRPASPIVFAQLVRDELGSNQFRELCVNVCKDEVIGLLARSLVSESPLSDLFLVNKGGALNPQMKLGTKLSFSVAKGVDTTPLKIPITTLNLKVTANKSTNKILFAEATDEFFDFLCSFLTTPIGSMAHLLDGNSGLKCIDNLYLSVLNLEDKWFLSKMKSELQNPNIALHHNCKKQPLRLKSRTFANSFYLMNPRAKGIHSNNFTQEPSLFVVPDDFSVKPLSLSANINLMREVNVGFSDMEEQLVTVGMQEALNLLKATLTSPSSALTDGLSSFLQQHKA